MELLVGCYRTGEAANPEVYTAALATVLSEYPEAVVLRVTDPRTGLPGRAQWLPTVAEVKQECERLMRADVLPRYLNAPDAARLPAPKEDRKSVLDDLAEKHPELFAGYRARWGAGAKTNGGTP